jgi:hypothetical protein
MRVNSSSLPRFGAILAARKLFIQGLPNSNDKEKKTAIADTTLRYMDIERSNNPRLKDKVHSNKYYAFENDHMVQTYCFFSDAESEPIFDNLSNDMKSNLSEGKQKLEKLVSDRNSPSYLFPLALPAIKARENLAQWVKNVKAALGF